MISGSPLTLLLLLLLLWPSSLWAADAAIDWLRQMSDSSRMQNYRATFVYIHSGQVETLQLAHGYDAGVESELLTSLSGPQRRVVRNGDSILCLFPDDEQRVFSSPSSLSMPFSLPKLSGSSKRFYRIAFDGHDRVAGRSTRIVLVEPLDQNRYGYRLWIDESSFLPLRIALLNETGIAIEQVVFTHLEEMSKPPAELSESTQPLLAFSTATVGPAMPLLRSIGPPIRWDENRLPGGFKLHSSGKRRLSHAVEPVDHFIFSDGVASVSAFVEREEDGTDWGEGAANFGALNAFARRTGEYRLTVMGEAPVATLELISGALRIRISPP